MKSRNTGIGTYTMKVPPTLPPYSTLTILVTGVGSDSSYCNVAEWDSLSDIKAVCYAQGGDVAKETFDVSVQAWEQFLALIL